MHIYKEVMDTVTGVAKFMSLGAGNQGPWHGLPVSTPYMTKGLSFNQVIQLMMNS